jgi:hypothetical protein
MKKEGMLFDTDLLWVCEKNMVVTHKFHCSNEYKGKTRPQGKVKKTGGSSKGSREKQEYDKVRLYYTRKLKKYYSP